MFSLRGFLLKGLLDAVGKQPDYWVILNAAGWMEKGVLTEDDLAELQAAMEGRQAAAAETPEQPAAPEPETEPGIDPETAADTAADTAAVTAAE